MASFISDSVVPYLSKQKLPVLEIEDGKFIFSSNSAAKYLFLKGKIPTEEASMDEILSWESEVLLPVIAPFLVFLVGQAKRDSKLIEKVEKALQFVDKKLGASKFLTGDTFGVADVCVFCTIYPLFNLKNSSLADKFTNLRRFYDEVSSKAVVQGVLSEEWKENNQQDAFKASLLAQRFPPIPGASASVSPAAAKPSASVSLSVSSEDQVPVEKVSQEEADAALKAWGKDPKDCPKPRVRQHPVLPDPKARNIMVTSALPYVNNVPHLGNIIGCVLSADVYSRFARLRNYNVLYVCGTDEYGTATETKAMEEGVTPKEICDKYNKLHTQIYEWFNIDFDYFGRTTTELQTEIAQDIFWKLYQEGYILKDSIEQLYCTKCNKFLADRFVEGTCPMCGFDDARGDQCDGCGKLINAVELINPKCKMCKSSPVVKSTQHLFVDLPKLEPKLKDHLNRVYESGTWTNNARVITNSWIRDGLKPRCISRDLKWGTPIPLEGYTDKVFYVWFDAPIGYISITANYTDKWREWWKNDEKVEMYNFLGKDNVPFHSVIFPSCLLGANDKYTVVNHMIATEYLNYEDTKFSKSRGSGVFGDQARDTGIPADVYRFYLLYLRPESQDTAFSWDDFLLKNNSELLNNLGNFINRALMFLNNNFAGKVQEMQVNEEDTQLLALISREIQGYVGNLEACRLRDGIRNILTISRLGNQYMQNNKPWVLAKGNAEEKLRAGCVVSLCANVSCLLSVLLQPYMPSISATIQGQLQAPSTVNVITGEFVAMLKPGHQIGKPSPLFQKIEASTMADLKARFEGKPAEKPAPKKGGGAPAVAVTKASPEEVERLTKAVSDQGNKVRELKTAKAEKSIVDAEVATLLKLKQELAAAQGVDPNAAAGGKKKGGKSGGGGGGGGKSGGGGGGGGKKEKAGGGGSGAAPAVASPAVNGGAGDSPSSPEVARLTQAVADQGNKVRDLKAAKAEKSAIDTEVASLLQLKRELAVAQGQDPDAAVGGGSSKKKGKKK
ncbi:methionine--tRNA ligase, cytoplasmic [Aplysia californica]|uniref:Methionine--tRNA ligase, cytoplasmic n=1 Tax=Aplysia californica TaxID=6500 RepID=A0ABM0JPG3_APLCA|nr:methionine--tRNA ligase, cytoplasmic [Aplysia californica]